MPSTKIEDLVPAMQPMVRQFIEKAAQVGFNLRITASYRSNEEQAELYAQGRTKPGPIVTNAKPGQSLHNTRRAIDIVDRQKGYDLDWEKLGRIGESCGLEWGGRWQSFKDRTHFQYTGPAEVKEQRKEQPMDPLDSIIIPRDTVRVFYRHVRNGENPEAGADTDRPLRFLVDMLTETKNRGIDQGKRELQGALEQAANEIRNKNTEIESLKQELANRPVETYEPVGQLFVKR